MTRPRRGLAGLLLIAVMVSSACSGGDDKALGTTLLTTPYALLDGGSSSLAAHEGTPILLNFFASWCAPCVAEMPDIEVLHQEFGDRVAFIGLDTQEKAEEGRKIVQKTGVTYEIGHDPDGTFFAAFGGLGMPTTVLIRADGSVADTHSGALTADKLRAMINKAFF